VTGLRVTAYECSSVFSRKERKMFFDKEKCFVIRFSHPFDNPRAHFYP